MGQALLDDDEAVALRLVGALVTFLLVALLVFAVQSSRAPNKAALPAPIAEQEVPGASVVVLDGMVKFYFANASSALAAGAHAALAPMLMEIKAGRSAVLSGFHDSTGDPALNAELAQQRAQSVKAALLRLGAPPERIDLIKPLEMTGAADDAEGRRVEVTLR
jgi:outer membrane protein OmpA-like peptidoglycan-associated protein